MVLAFREIGRGLTALETFAQCLNMPNCITQAPYDSIKKSLLRSYTEVSHASQAKAAKETKEELGLLGIDDVVDCSVSVDGTWQKRGYSSLNGVVTLMSNANGKCLDTQALSKSCRVCKYWERRKDETQGLTNQHACSINHKESAGAMEVSGAITMFKRSVACHNLRYTGYIGDGDTKAHQSVVDSKPYGDDTKIDKLECIGHVQKRMGTRLRNLVKDMRGQKLSDGKPLSGRNRLTKKTINMMQNYYGMAIRQNVSCLYSMKKSVMAILFHCSESSDEEDRHKFCPRTEISWCKYQSDKITGKNTYKAHNCIPKAVKEVLIKIFKDLSSDVLLSKCLHGQTQNINECLHSLIWQRCPKEVHTSRMTMEIAAASAVVQYNEGATRINCVMKRLGIVPGKFMTKAGKIRDKKRLNNSLRKSSETGKKRRKQLRSARKGYEDKEKEQEGDIYLSGAY